MWVLFALLLFPAGFAGWAVGHYTSLGKPSATVTQTVTAAASSTPSTPATTASSTPASTTTPSSSGNVAAGKAVFASSSCATCHTFKPAGATGTIGPNLDTQPAVDAKLTHLSVAAFIKRCITDPYAFIPKGYQKGIMPATFGKTLSSKQIDDLVAFVVSGSSKS